MILAATTQKKDSAATTQENYARAIEKVLAQDKAIVDQFRGKVKSDGHDGDALTTAAQSTAAQSTAAIDLRECPEDFRIAYTKYTNAQTAFADEYRAYPRRTSDQIVWFLANVVRGERDAGYSRLRGGDEKAMSEVRASANAVNEIAVKYNAKVPPPSAVAAPEL